MNPAYAILGGLAVGALIGYQLAPTLINYPPYSWIHAKVAPTSYASQIVAQAQSAGGILGALANTPLQTAVAAGQEVSSELQNLFN
jgi:hypothetical protein